MCIYAWRNVIDVEISLSVTVHMTREGALDAASLLNISELGKTKAQALKTDFVTFNPADFCDKVVSTFWYN